MLGRRKGDQRPPTPNDLPSIQALVMQDLQSRTELGVQRYGTPLQPFNGRDALLDAYEEALDLATYLRQVRYERATIARTLREIASDVHEDLAGRIMEIADALD